MARFGMSVCTMFHLTRETAFEMLAENGFREIELSGIEGYFDNWEVKPTQDMRRALDAAGLWARVVHVPPRGWTIGDGDDESCFISLYAACTCLFQAALLGSEAVVIHPNFYPRFRRPDDEALIQPAWERSREALATLAERAGLLGLKMAVEPATVDVETVMGLIEGLGDHVGICLDTGHINTLGRDPAEGARIAGKKLFTLHLQDNDGSGADQHRIPGRGVIDWDAFIDTLYDMGFDGPAMFEVGNVNYVDPRPIIEECAGLKAKWEARWA